MTGRLEINSAGRVTGPASISYNAPWPCANGTPGGSGAMMGLVVHTEDGYEQGTIAWFNNPASQASAFFAVGQDGAIWQFGPVGHNWMAWAEEAGNPSWYSVEDADNGHPSTPFTDAQMEGIAQLAEVLSRFAGFPLEVTDSVDVKGIGIHSMGGVPWGDHLECPGPVRAAQRPEIIRRAQAIRTGGGAVTPPAKPAPVLHVTEGLGNLSELAAANKVPPSTIIRLSTLQTPDSYPQNVGDWLNAILEGTASPTASMPAGLHLYVPGS